MDGLTLQFQSSLGCLTLKICLGDCFPWLRLNLFLLLRCGCFFVLVSSSATLQWAYGSRRKSIQYREVVLGQVQWSRPIDVSIGATISFVSVDRWNLIGFRLIDGT